MLERQRRCGLCVSGRATVDLTVKKGGSGTFGFVNGDEVKTTTLRIVVDGQGFSISISISVSMSMSMRSFLHYLVVRGA